MHKTLSEVKAFVSKFNTSYQPVGNQIVGLAVPYIYLNYLQQNTKEIIISAEDCSSFVQPGAYTSAISATMLNSLGIGYTIVGHSERRKVFGDSDEVVNAKLKAALDGGLKVIFCIGEPLEVFKSNSTYQFIANQLNKGLAGVNDDMIKNVIIAYEPVWAIGTGETATPKIAQSAIKYIRGVISDMHNKKIAEAMLIQYGGSVNPTNARILMDEPDIDGLLIGGASLDPATFLDIISETRVKESREK